ncbi:MAG TPA: S1 RNA-binding domain-containing protein [Chloroflexi bacterium]|nr:S1 RNA-binding domain-containing protein [Chloroflexota bacterium]
MEIENQDPEQETSQKPEENSSEQPGWFQEFVDHYDVDKPLQGEMLTGKILDIQEGSILLDVGLKKDAIIPGQDLDKVDPDYLKGLAVGEEITVGVIRTPLGDDDLLVSLHRGLTQKTWVKAEELAENDQVVELEVVDQNRGGLLVAFDNMQAFVPNSHIPAIRRGTSTQKAGEIKAGLIGKTLPFKVIEVNQKERKLVFSARAAQREQRLKRLEEIQVGQVIKSRVVNVVDFGVFVDLDGVDGLVHKSEIDWERVTHPSKRFKVGDEIEVKVISVDKENERVSLSRKILLPNPWKKLVEDYKVGDLVEGVVVSVLDFGAFVEIREGLHGLIHISEIGYSNAEDPKAVLKKGDPVLVKIIGIKTARERISLSMRRVPVSEQMEWIMNLEDASEDVLLESDRVDLKEGKETLPAPEEDESQVEIAADQVQGEPEETLPEDQTDNREDTEPAAEETKAGGEE